MIIKNDWNTFTTMFHNIIHYNLSSNVLFGANQRSECIKFKKYVQARLRLLPISLSVISNNHIYSNDSGTAQSPFQGRSMPIAFDWRTVMQTPIAQQEESYIRRMFDKMICLPPFSSRCFIYASVPLLPHRHPAHACDVKPACRVWHWWFWVPLHC
jgi:hypothetical protein